MEGLRRREEEDGDDEGCTEQQAVYCAVAVGAAGGKEWKANLQWVLATFSFSFPRGRRLVLAHLHRPPSRINMMGAWVPVRQLAEEEVTAYRQLEEKKINKVLDDLLAICRSQKVNASKIIVACDDTARGLIQLVHDHGVAELVMGAASDRGYTRKMRAPRSKKALMVQREANPSCKIWFVCKGNFICTREASEGLNRAESSATSTSPRSSASNNSSSKSWRRIHSMPFSMQESANQATSSAGHTPSSSREDDGMDHGIEDFSHEATVVAGPPTVSDGGETDDELYKKLKDAFLEAENLRHEAYEETRRRQKAERDLGDASRMAMDAESSCQREAKHRKEMEERLARERAAMQQDRQELDGILEQTHKVDERCAELELQITNSERVMGELQVRLSESYSLLDALRREGSRRPEDAASECTSMDTGVSFLWLGYSELEEATNHFDESARIGGEASDRGSVYRGNLRGMAVAVKMISPDAAVDEARFTREVEAISRARHPDLVAVVGACPEARAVVYELVAGGSLEERLGGERPLPWHARCGVAYRACSALAFLHSTQPRPTVHGEVRPENILLDEQRSSSKLGGLGMRRLAGQPGGKALAYVDPQYLATGELSPQCDVYSLGVVLLRLVSGKPAFVAKKAADGSRAWEEVVDVSAGGWPMERGREVALLGLACCEVKRRGDPRELLEEARRVLEGAMSTAPPYFVCPILRKVMRDPQIAGDGFTYEAETMREWLDSGHHTSPMTNLRLPTRDLIPNHALRSAIHQWRRRH